MNETPTVSVILPVYNVEAYLRECLDSIRRQTFGDFELICIDDGSTDSSGTILDAAARQDSRLRVFHQPNGGVSQARNRGLSLARGEYLYFCDPDDFCHRRLLEVLVRKARADCAEVVRCERRSFDCVSGKPMGRMTFPEWVWDAPSPFAGVDHARNLLVDFGTPIGDKLLLRRFVEDNGLRFQENVRRFALNYFMTMAIVLAKRISVVPDCLYFYRENRPGSLQQTREESPLDVITARRAVADELKRRGLFEKFELGFMMSLMRVGKSQLEGTRLPENRKLCFAALKDLGREVVSRPGFPMMDFRWTPEGEIWRGIEAGEVPSAPLAAGVLRTFEMKTPWLLELRERGRKIRGVLRRKFGHGGLPPRTGLRLQLNFFRELEGDLLFEGTVFSDRADAVAAFHSLALVERTGTREVVRRLCDDSRGLTETPEYGTSVRAWRYVCRFPVSSAAESSFVWSSSDPLMRIDWRDVEHTRYSPFTNLLRFSYTVVAGRVFSFSKGVLRARQATASARMAAEFLLCLNLFRKHSRIALKALLLRWFVRLHRFATRRSLWLFSDRVDRADDNGRAFFEYVAMLPRSENPPRCVFAISSRASEIGELKRFGKVVDIESFRYKLAFLLSECVVSSHHTRQNRFPFDDMFACYAKDFVLRPKFILLRHGVCQNDTSRVQNRWWDNAAVMLTVSERERASMTTPSYGYTNREVRVCGFPRYDLLKNAPKRYVTFMPTWRESIIDWDELGRHRPSATAGGSDFVRIYSEVLSDAELIAACQATGYAVQVMPHPNLRPVLPLLKMDPAVRILPETMSYGKVFAETNLLITDYSSTAFDFAYLRKPVIYFQFDRETFFGRIYLHGYFDAPRDGFGPVLETVAALKKEILASVSEGCPLTSEYRQRIDDFFAFNDADNCKRTYREIRRALSDLPDEGDFDA